MFLINMRLNSIQILLIKIQTNMIILKCLVLTLDNKFKNYRLK